MLKIHSIQKHIDCLLNVWFLIISDSSIDISNQKNFKSNEEKTHHRQHNYHRILATRFVERAIWHETLLLGAHQGKHGYNCQENEQYLTLT